MKIAILAAGKGTRMLPLTEDRPKPLVRVLGKPFLKYLIENILKAGFWDIAILVGRRGEMIRNWASEENYDLTFIEQEEQKGTGHAVKLLKEWSGDENFIVVNGDNLISSEDLKRFNKQDGMNYIGAYRVEDVSSFGELIIEGEFLKEIKEKMPGIRGGLINSGVYKFTKEIYEILESLKRSPRGEYEVTDALTDLGVMGKVKKIDIDDYWVNFSGVDDIKKAERVIARDN